MSMGRFTCTTRVHGPVDSPWTRAPELWAWSRSRPCYNMTETALPCIGMRKLFWRAVDTEYKFACFPGRRCGRPGLGARHLLNWNGDTWVMFPRRRRGVSLSSKECDRDRGGEPTSGERRSVAMRLNCWQSVSVDDDSERCIASVVFHLCRHCFLSRLCSWQ